MKMFCSQRVKVSAALDGKRLFLSLQSSVLDPQPSVLGPKLELELARGLFSWNVKNKNKLVCAQTF